MYKDEPDGAGGCRGHRRATLTLWQAPNGWRSLLPRPVGRGKGLGRAIIAYLLEAAATQVKQVHLSVVTTNAAAVRLYEQLGFRTYGTEPRSLRVGERYYDEHLMVMRFD